MSKRFLNLVVIVSIVSLGVLSSCDKDDDPTPELPDYSQDKGEFTDARDGKVYKWVKIGDQIWMAENLNYTGGEIQHITDGNEWVNNTDYDGWCYYDNNVNNGNTYGVLYQWEAAKKAPPSGWHLPTDDEWTTLTDYLGGYNVAGGKMKEIGTTHWNSPNTGADNSSGFTALPGGNRSFTSGTFYFVGDGSAWYSNTENGSSSSFGCSLFFNIIGASRYTGNKLSGYSVRCVKD